MKLCSAPLDDVFQELQFVLDQDGSRFARLTRWLFVGAYRMLLDGMLLALRLRWRTRQYPDLGDEPFNLTREELGREWERQ
jgi:hypothetical protein